MDEEKAYALLRRELTRAQARLKRAEGERDRLSDENHRLRALLAAHGVALPKELARPEPV
jgi:hypothetical protein